MSSTKTKTKSKTKIVVTKPPLHNIVIWNDETSSFEMVKKLIEVVFNYDETQSKEFTKKIHENDNAIVWSGSKEVGKTYIAKTDHFKQKFPQYLSNLKITLEEC